eukprot:XP_017945575.1 PREDICTED: sialoadhesin-like [Xenopus tropicalis]
MMERYRHLHRIILMVVLQGGFPGSYSQDWAITLPESIRALSGSCVEIPCTFTRPGGNKDFSLVWYKQIDFRRDKIIFSQQNPSDVSEGYRRRTSLVGNEPNSCSLRINDVQESETYYPYIHGNCDVISECQKVQVTVSDSPKNVTVVISDGKKERKEGDAVSLTCASDANPAANAFTWYNNKRDGTVELREEQGRSITVTVGRGRETFSCTARNPLGTGNSTLSELQVLYKAKDVTIKGKDEVKEGAALELECHFSDYNPPTTQYSYSWYLNGNPVNGETGRILQINNITESHSGNYSCNVQNGAGPSYSPGFAVTLMSAQTREGLPMRIILGGGAGAVLVILLALGLYLFLRHRKSQKGGESGGRGAEANVQNPQATESPYINLQKRDTAVYEEMKNFQPTESPYTALQKRDVHNVIKVK